MQFRILGGGDGGRVSPVTCQVVAYDGQMPIRPMDGAHGFRQPEQFGPISGQSTFKRTFQLDPAFTNGLYCAVGVLAGFR